MVIDIFVAIIIFSISFSIFHIINDLEHSYEFTMVLHLLLSLNYIYLLNYNACRGKIGSFILYFIEFLLFLFFED
jgi:hypothetical protein